MTIQTGTLISGTHAEYLLISTFMDELDSHAPEKAERIRDEYGASFIDRCCQPRGMDYSLDNEMEEVSFLLTDLFDTLDAIAPEGHYFGAIEGDGADFGFWPVAP